MTLINLLMKWTNKTHYLIGIAQRLNPIIGEILILIIFKKKLISISFS